MGATEIVEIISNVIGGLCIFLLGMKYMSEGMQAVAGERLRKMIGAVTNRRLIAVGTGAAVTSLIQSSSVTAVLSVGMVNAGVMTLMQAIGVLLGADIGTTITAWIVAMKVTHYGLPLLGLAGFFYLFSRNERVRYIAMMTMGVGMVFFGLELMKHGLEPLKHSEGFVAMFSKFSPGTFPGLLKCVLAGAFVTAIVQSSSATVAITITLARAGVIEYDQAVALVLGENIGTTITAYLASLGASTNAKRVATAHILTKVIGVSIMLTVFPLYMRWLTTATANFSDIAKQIAVAHSLFNVLLVCFFLPLMGPFSKLLIKLIPDKAHKEKPHLTFLDVRMLDTPAFGIKQSLDEVVRMSEGVEKMMDWVKPMIDKGKLDKDIEKKIFHREEVLDVVQKEIVEFLGGVLSLELTHEVASEAREQLRMADEYESISDYIVSLLKLHLRMQNSDMSLHKDGKQALLELHDDVSNYIKMVNEAVAAKDIGIISKARSQGDSITRVIKAVRKDHLDRLEQQSVSPLNCLIFIDMLQLYRKIKDHMHNIAEAVAGEK